MVGPNNLLLFTIIFIFKDASSNIVAPHSWGFLFVVMCTGYGYYNLPYIDGVSYLWDDG